MVAGLGLSKLLNYRRFLFATARAQTRKLSAASWSSSKSPYEILGVSSTASDKEIKRAYLKLAKQYHPDTNKNADAANKFKEISTAYEILSSSAKRAEFENQSKYRPQGDGFPNSNKSYGFGNNNFSNSKTYTYNTNVNPEDIFRDFFKNSSWGTDFFAEDHDQIHNQQSTQKAYKNVRTDPKFYEINLKVSFLDSILGTSKEAQVEIDALCTYCNGNGADTSAGYQRCSNCKGSGYVSKILGGIMSIQTLCTTCRGSGKTMAKSCSHCSGRGRTKKQPRLKINIPAGIVDGQILRQTIGGCEIMILVSVLPSSNFWREGKNIHSYLDLSYPQAFIGATIDVEGVHGLFKVDIPSGTSSGEKIRKAGRGIKSQTTFNSHGDHILHIRIKTPKLPSEKEKALVMALADLECNEEPVKTQDNRQKKDPSVTSFSKLFVDPPNAGDMYKGMIKTARGIFQMLTSRFFKFF
ncbi:MAG: DnaJ subfamily A member 3, mitochondrial, variant 2 [Marteilia pararefringens]